MRRTRLWTDDGRYYAMSGPIEQIEWHGVAFICGPAINVPEKIRVAVAVSHVVSFEEADE